MINKYEVENMLSGADGEITSELLTRRIGYGNTKKISAILEILKIEPQSVADTKIVLEICEKLVETDSYAFLGVQFHTPGKY